MAGAVLPASPHHASSPAALLSLQRTAGNRATVAVMQRTPDAPIPAPPAHLGMDAPAAKDPAVMAMTLGPMLHKNLEHARLLHLFGSSEFAELEKKKDGSGLTESEWARHDALKADLPKLSDHIGTVQADFDLATNPGNDPKKLNELLARHGAAVKVAPQQIDDAKPTAVTDTGATWGGTTGTSQVVRGADGRSVAHTSTTEEKRNVSWSDKGAAASWGTTEKIEGVKGAGKASHETSQTTGVSYTGGDVNVTSTKGYKTEETAGDVTTTKQTSLSQQLGLSGYSATLENSKQVGDAFTSTTGTAAIKRGGGELGFQVGGSQTTGTKQGDKLETGSTTGVTGGAGIVAGPKEAGVTGNIGAEHSKMLGKGVSLGATTGMGGRWTVKIEEVSGTEPKKYRLLTTIKLSVTLGGSAGWQGESKAAGASGTGKLGVTGSAAKWAVFGPVMGEAEAAEYLAVMKAGGAGGTYPSHKLLAKGLLEGWDEAARAWAMLNKDASPEDAKKMAEGEVRESGSSTGFGITPGGSGKLGGTGAGVEGGYSSQSSVSVREEKLAGGKLKLIATVADSTAWSAGVTATQGPAGGGGSYSQTEGRTRAFTFVLDTTGAGYNDRYGAIYAAKTADDLVKLAQKYPNDFTERTGTDSEGSGSGAKMNLGPLGIGIAGGGEVSSTETYDAKGQYKGGTYTGTSTGGGDLSIGGQKVYGEKVTEGYTGTVDEAGQRTGDTSVEKRETSIGKTIIKTAERFEQDPLGTILAGPTLEEEVDTKGTLLSEAALKRIEAESHPSNHSAWMSRVASPSKRPEWAAARQQIHAAAKRGDAVAVQKALARWTGQEGHGRVAAIESVAGDMGVKYNFPETLAHLKADYQALVMGDPLSWGRSQAASGMFTAAVNHYSGVKSKAEMLRNALHTHEADFSEPLIYAEMLGRVTKVLNASIQATQQARTLKATNKDLAFLEWAPGQPTTPPDTKEDVQAGERKAAVEAYENNVTLLRSSQQRIFQAIGEAEAQLNKSSLFRDWDLALSRLRNARTQLDTYQALFDSTMAQAGTWGLDKGRLGPLHPLSLRDRWRTVDARTRMAGM